MGKLLHSVAFKATSVLVASCLLLALIVSYLGDKAGREIAVRGVVAVAETQTLGMAERLVGPIRFKRFEDVGDILEDALSRSELAVDAIVVAQSGGVLDRSGSQLADEDVAILADLATLAIESGEIVRSETGLIFAVPLRKSTNDPVVGAVATVWTSAPFLATIGEYRRLQIFGAGIALVCLVLLSAVVMHFTIGKPIVRAEARASHMADGDLESAVPGLSRKGEIGGLAKSMEQLRKNLQSAEIAAKAAFYESAGFQSSSAPQVLCDETFRIASVNTSFTGFLAGLGYDDIDLVGDTTDAFHIECLAAANLRDAEFPMTLEFQYQRKTLSVTITNVVGEGVSKGYVIEWQDVSDAKVSEGILHALEEGQMRIDFDGSCKILSASDRARAELGRNASADLGDLISLENGDLASVKSGHVYFGRLNLNVENGRRILDGSISPIKDAEGRVNRFVLLGNDVTEAETNLENARTRAEALAAGQSHVVSELKAAMQSLASGSLTSRIEMAFPNDYEELRQDFNSSVSSLDDAISKVLSSASQIGLDVDGVADAITDFASRTEHQASTLQETSSALAELSKSVSDATNDANDARTTVLLAQDQATSSSDIVRDTIGAMSEIEESSTKISSIISVIDDIAFQTNLLALNAGVEAARAGDAGRGFAVVASEVRELAQRSAGAASEISQLICTSGEQVKIGVSLVDQAGAALNSIAETIGAVAEKVETISRSAEEQSTGIEEINHAMQSLDQATQQSVAMFEETSASVQELQLQSRSLQVATAGFVTSGDVSESAGEKRIAS